MEAEGSLPPLQILATCPYPEPDKSKPSPHPASWRYNLILSSRLRLSLPSGLFPLGFSTKALYASLFSHVHATCYAQPILDLITQIIYGEKYR